MSESDLDAAIDDVAREMTAGDLDAAFRARVLQRIESGTGTRDWGFGLWRPGLVALGAAAMIVAAVVTFRGRHERAITVSPIAHASAAPATPARAGTSTRAAGPPLVAHHPVRRGEFTGGPSEIDALAPPLLDVPSIALVELPAPESIQLDQLQTIPPIAVAPLAADDQGERR